MNTRISLAGGGLSADLRMLAGAIARGELIVGRAVREPEPLSIKLPKVEKWDVPVLIDKPKEHWRRGRPLR